MRPEPDDRDHKILATRQATYDAIPGPRVGDWVLMPDGEMRRFTHAWPDGIQTTCVAGESGSFYLGDGYVSYSGSLDDSIPYDRIRDTSSVYLGRVWFFHGDWHRANNGVHFEILFRVFEVIS